MEGREDVAGGRRPGRVGRRVLVLGIEAGDAPQQVERIEVDLVVDRLERGDDLLVEAGPEIRLAGPEVDEKALEIGLLGERRLAARLLPDVGDDRREDLLLVEAPELLEVGLERLVADDGPAGDDAEPARGHPGRSPFGEDVRERDLADPRREGARRAGPRPSRRRPRPGRSGRPARRSRTRSGRAGGRARATGPRRRDRAPGASGSARRRRAWPG